MAPRNVGINSTFDQQRVVINEIAVDVDNILNAGYATTTYVGTVISGLTSVSYVDNKVAISTSGLASVSYVDNKVAISTSGLLTPTSSGSSLTGIVTSITAGSGISIDQSTGNVTITSLGGAGGENLDQTLGIGNTSSKGMSVGVVTATSFVKSGGTSSQFLKADGSVDSNSYLTSTSSGSSLTGIVTSITAGSGISIDQSTGNVTITATGGGGGGESYWVSTAAGIHTLSNVGIGTTDPTDRFAVVSSSDSNWRTRFIGNEVIISNNSTNDAISPAYLIQQDYPYNSFSLGFDLGAFLYLDNSFSRKASVGFFKDDSNGTGIYLSPTGFSGLLTAGEAGITIRSNKNVGIGTTNPTTKLQIDGILGFGANNNVKIGNNTTGISLNTGINNSFAGPGSGSSTTDGSNNIFIGFEAGYVNLDGASNNFLGYRTGYKLTTGIYNQFVGSSAGYNNTNGSYNNYIGANAGLLDTGGSYNTFIGNAAGSNSTSGNHNVAIGNGAQLPISTGSTQLALGSNGTYWIYGNSSGNVGLGTTNPTSKLTVQGNVNVSGAVTAASVTLSGNLIDSSNSNYYFNPGQGGNLAAGFYVTNDPVSYGTYVQINDDQIYAYDGITGGSFDIRSKKNENSYINGGNLGIGTDTPISKLDVRGDVSIASTANLTQITETVVNAFNTTLSPSSGTLTVDTSLGTVVLGDLDASVTTWAFTNVPTANSKATTVTLIIDGDTAQTYGDACSVNGSAITNGVKWSGGSAPTATNNFDVITFTIVKDSAGTINVFGSGNTNFS